MPQLPDVVATLPLDNIHGDDLRRFETYRNYLQRFCGHSRALHHTWLTLAQACATDTKTLQGGTGLDLTWISRFLSIAWNTECLMRNAPDSSDLMRVYNAWLPVQAYYAVYAGAEALSYAIDGEKADGHIKALRKATSFFVNGSIPPWNLAYAGAVGRDGKSHKQKNFPTGLRPAHNLSGVGTADDLGVIATCLKAEHQNRVKEDYKRGRKRQYEYDPGDTALLHFLYRLRIRSNYRGIDLFLVEAGEEAHRSFRQSLLCVVTRTLTYMEIALMRKCRRSVVTEMAEGFAEKNPLAGQLKNRFRAYQSLY